MHLAVAIHVRDLLVELTAHAGDGVLSTLASGEPLDWRRSFTHDGVGHVSVSGAKNVVDARRGVLWYDAIGHLRFPFVCD